MASFIALKEARWQTNVNLLGEKNVIREA